MKKPNPGQETAGKAQWAAARVILADSSVVVIYPEEQCPVCQRRPGTEPGICHLLPSASDPVSVFIYFGACARCDRQTRNATGEAHEKISKKTVQFLDRWLELEFGQKRAAA